MKNCINLTTEEVRMILAGGTKLVIPFKNQPTDSEGNALTDLGAGIYTPSVVDKNGDEQPGDDVWGAISSEGERCCRSPFQPGKVIYGRETFFQGVQLDDNDQRTDEPYLVYYADTKDSRPGDASDFYCANVFGHDKKYWPAWNSSATMPKSAARIFLRIESVEVQAIAGRWCWIYFFTKVDSMNP